jgi:hypothetical protein
MLPLPKETSVLNGRPASPSLWQSHSFAYRRAAQPRPVFWDNQGLAARATLPRPRFPKAMTTTIRQGDLIESIAAALQYISNT